MATDQVDQQIPFARYLQAYILPSGTVALADEEPVEMDSHFDLISDAAEEANIRIKIQESVLLEGKTHF